MSHKEQGAIVLIDGPRRRLEGCIFGQHCVVKGEIELGEDVIIGSLALVEGKNIKIGD